MDINSILSALEDDPSEKYESETLEFKEYTDAKHLFSKGRDIAKEICAMANNKGGYVLVGVKDSSNITNGQWIEQLVGIEEFDCLEVEKRLIGNLSPSISLSVENHNFKGSNYLVIMCEPHYDGIVMTQGGRCYLRSGRDSNPMTPEQVAEKIKSAKSYDWSYELCQDLSLEDALDDEQVEQALNQYHDLKQLGEGQLPKDYFLESIGVTRNGVITKGGLLFLGQRDIIETQFGNLEYRFSHSEGGGQLSINEVWSGSIWSAIYKITELFKKVIFYENFVFDGKIYSFPNVAHALFDEAVINSLVHRDYSVDGMVTIEFTPSLMTLVNPGLFYDGITAENIFTHPPRHRNRALAEILRKFELLDRAGFGTKRMSIESLRLGRNKPRFKEENGFIFTYLELGVVKEGVYVVTSPFEDYDVIELMLINIMHESGYENIKDIFIELEAVTSNPWKAIQRALTRMPFLSLIGNKSGVYLIVDESHREALNVNHIPRVSPSSGQYVSIFSHLMKNGSDDLRRLASAATDGDSVKVQRLLTSAAFVKKNGRGKDAVWSLI